MKRRIALLLVCLLACLTACTQDNSLAYQKAVDLFGDGQYAEAAKAFLDYLCSAEADAVFEAVGFTPVA